MAVCDWLLKKEKEEEETGNSVILENIKAIQRDQVIQQIRV